MTHQDLPQPAAAAATTAKAPATSYVLTPAEAAAARRLLDRRKAEPPAPRYKVTHRAANTVRIEADHPEPICTSAQLADMLCTGDLVFAEGVIRQLADAARTGRKLTSEDLNAMLATVRAIGPRDPTEALLAVQMAAIHNATLGAARLLNQVEAMPQYDSAANALTRLSRTFCAQVEALKRYRTSGEQKVTVQHQHVNVSANQAVVGISQGGGEAREKSSQSHAPSAAGQSGPALLGQEQALRAPLPVAGGPGPACVPHARSARGRAGGQG